MAKSSAFTKRFTASMDRRHLDVLDVLIENEVFASYSHAFRSLLMYWLRQHKYWQEKVQHLLSGGE